MNIKELINAFHKGGGEKAKYSKEDVLFLLNQIDEHTKVSEARIINCIVIEDDYENEPVVKTFLSTDFESINGIKLVLKDGGKNHFINQTETKSIILQLEGKLNWNIDDLYEVCKQTDSDNYWD